MSELYTQEKVILQSLMYDEDYCRAVIPYIKPDYMVTDEGRAVFIAMADYVNKHSRRPTKDALKIDVQKMRGMLPNDYERAMTMVDSFTDERQDLNWLMENTEEFCKGRAVYLAIERAVNIQTGHDKEMSVAAIPGLLSDALAVGFDNTVGHDYFEDYEARFDAYHQEQDRIPFDIDALNDATGGGIGKKTLTVILAGTNVGKSLVMCHQAAANLRSGKNVLYITMEMEDIKISERVDANMLGVTIDDLRKMEKTEYFARMSKCKEKYVGRLIVKEYPTGSGNAAMFRNLLRELKVKKKFIPDVVYIDYINICASSRLKNNGTHNSYTVVKAIAEELRGLSMENDFGIVTATQTTRGGLKNSDPDLTDTSESIGLPFTADFMYAIITNEELEKRGVYLCKQLKNRLNEIGDKRRFLIGVSRPKMTLYNVDQDGVLMDMGEGVPKVSKKPLGDDVADGKSNGLSSFLASKLSKLT